MKIEKVKKDSKKLNLKLQISKLKKKSTLPNDEIINPNNTKPKKSLGRLILGIILSLGIIFISLLTIFLLYIVIRAPKFDTDLLYNQESTIMYDKNGNEYARLGAENRTLVTYNDLPQVLVDAIVATEDSRFFQHNGFDIARFLKASFGQLAGSDAGGASTITMQVVKNTYTNGKLTSGVKGIIRKFTDIYMSVFMVEKQYTKEEIIEFYVNQPWLGNNTYGVEQACQLYFGKSVRDLNLSEAAIIAGMFNAPGTYNPFNDIESTTKRRDTVLNLMYKHGYITEEEMLDAKAITVAQLTTSNSGQGLNKYQTFIDAVVNEVEDDTGLNPYNVSMKINTTLDPSIEDTLVSLGNGDLYKFVDEYVQVAVAITDVNNGSVTAILGGRNQTQERAYNLATQMKRHPGSTAKPIFDYGPLIEYKGASTGTYFWDEPYSYSNGSSIKNADAGYLGMITMRTALVKSRNIPALEAFQQLSTDEISTFVHSLGIDYGDYLYESASIGGFDGATPLEMAAAYSAFARGGYYIEPYTYTSITFTDSGEVTEQKVKKEKVMSEETAYMITDMLVTAGQNNVGGNFSISGTDIAAKTGTSTYDDAALKAKGISGTASRDNWNITYSPDYTISLWYGYKELEKEHYTTSLKAAYARKQMMAAIAKKIYPKNSRFTKPSGVVSVEVEKDSVPLQLPSAYTPSDMRTTELFKTGTEPTETSIRYNQLDNPTNGKASVSGNIVNLSWDATPTPQAIDTTYLQNYFTENYKTFATKYYNNRINYNNSYIGTLGYAIYLKTDTTLTYLGYTSQNNYTYVSPTSGAQTFVVKSCYSIFKDNMSSGLTITSGSTTGSTSSLSIVVNNKTVCLPKTENTAYFQDDNNPLKITYNNKDVTASATITSIITDSNNNKVTSIDTTKEGIYNITYNITYNGESTTATKKITVATTCN